MSKKGNLFTTTLRLNLDNAQDMEAWNNLLSADSSQPEYSSYSRTIVTALNDHFARLDQPDQEQWMPVLLQKIQESVRETIISTMKEITVTAAPPVSEGESPKGDAEQADETEATIEAFLDCF
ncbi:MAG: hypothetical protein J6A79_15490 [Clostridia bacterium]|nr:hypothetical protein [Clostridia bacterium]